MVRIQVSLRLLLVLMAALCGSLALSRAGFVISCGVLAGVIAVLNVLLPTRSGVSWPMAPLLESSPALF
jgi:hypothetical protein